MHFPKEKLKLKERIFSSILYFRQLEHASLWALKLKETLRGLRGGEKEWAGQRDAAVMATVLSSCWNVKPDLASPPHLHITLHFKAEE